MNNTLYWGTIIVVSAIIAIGNFVKSVKIEVDIKNGVDPKDAAKYHRRWFHKKEAKEAYEKVVSECHK